MPSELAIPEWLNKQFIEQALREGEKNSNILVKQINVRAATSAGDNYCSEMFRVTVDYDNDNPSEVDVPITSLIVKVIPKEEETMNYLTENDAFSTEIDVYSRLIPALHKLVNSSPGRHVSFGPKCYYYTDKPYQKLVLEDLCQSGFQMAQRSLGLDLDHSKLAVSNLGTFHAASVSLYRQDPQLFDSYLKYPHLKGIEAITIILRDAFNSAAKALPDVGQKFSEKLLHLGGTSLQRLEKAVERDEAGFNVLNHGDVWRNNMMFRYGVDGEVSDITFVDFQYCYWGSPVIDLLYFLYSSPSSEVRSCHTEELLECYHQSLSETLTRLGCGVKCPSLADIHLEIEKRSFMCIFTAIALLPAMYVNADNVRDLSTMMDGKSNACGDIHITEDCTKEFMKILPLLEMNGWLQ